MAKEKTTKFPELTANEKLLIKLINKAGREEVRAILQEKDVKIDCLDESGMTPLQHAAFRGKYDVAELLLLFGADVNSSFHENGYTALMFAALSGKPEVTRLMLQHGARKDRTNSVGKNACQMAAFVGQHQCVSVINNYYDKSELEYFTKPRGQETEPKLPLTVMPALLQLLNMSNMNPVKVSFHLQKFQGLMNESYKVCKVLDILCEKSMKARDTDDVMAVKTHYFATVIRKAKDSDSLDTWIKWLVKGRDLDGHPENQDKIIRQALKEFPYVESQLLQNMVRQLSMTKVGDSPTSLNILNQGINGQKFGFDVEQDCSICSEPDAKRCVKCKMAFYCNQTCQKLHWPTHKKFCAKLAEEYIQQEKMKEENRKREEEMKKLEEEEKARKQSEEEGKRMKEEEKEPTTQDTTNKDISENVETTTMKDSGDSVPEKEIKDLNIDTPSS
ncbi:Ankyrin repeat and MYND domain-containing protein 2 [Mactra antiquata]